MIRFLRYFLLLTLCGCGGSFAHVVSHFYAETKESGLEIYFDVGYAIPSEREDRTKPPMQLTWLEAQEENAHAALRQETERYLRQNMKFQQGGREVSWQLVFLDFESPGRSFMRMLNGLAYYRVHAQPMAVGSPVMVQWLPGTQPDLVVRTGADAYVTLKPGEQLALVDTTAAVVAEVEGQSAWLIAFQQGFLHVLPKGLDHILFLAGMFLAIGMDRRLLLQSLCFTAAHTVTLGLCSAGVMVASPSWVEPLIAASIAFLAMENILRKEPPETLRMVMIFVFGLIHGCGFAQVLALWIKGSDNFATALICANAGVEMAQVTVIVILWLVTLPLQKLRCYPRIRLLANAGILTMGVLWTWERIASSMQS